MGSFRRNGGGFRGNRSGGRAGGSRRGFGDRRSGGRDSRGSGRKLELHNATCDKCGKECEVPFRPTEGKPVYCSECFRLKESDSGAKRNKFEQRTNSNSTGITQEQFAVLNKKLDKILAIVETIEFEDEGEESEEDE